jgi:hypothetical protein
VKLKIKSLKSLEEKEEEATDKDMKRIPVMHKKMLEKDKRKKVKVVVLRVAVAALV